MKRPFSSLGGQTACFQVMQLLLFLAVSSPASHGHSRKLISFRHSAALVLVSEERCCWAHWWRLSQLDSWFHLSVGCLVLRWHCQRKSFGTWLCCLGCTRCSSHSFSPSCCLACCTISSVFEGLENWFWVLSVNLSVPLKYLLLLNFCVGEHPPSESRAHAVRFLC